MKQKIIVLHNIYGLWTCGTTVKEEMGVIEAVVYQQGIKKLSKEKSCQRR